MITHTTGQLRDTVTSTFIPVCGLLMQRKCAFGSPTSSLTGECDECKSITGLQAELTIGASNDPLEQEADRVAEQVLAAPLKSGVSGTPPRIQRFTRQSSDEVDTALASVDHVLGSSGRALEPALRQDMEQRFGHDFSRVRVHSDAAAEQSVREVNANAYTVGHNIVFGAGQFAPGTHEGRRLIAHELTHVVQQSSSDGIRVGQGNGHHGLSPIAFEPRFGHDFSQMRVHTDTKAAEPARDVNALAYTAGRDVVFGVERYAPRTSEGRSLLAHELTDVVQQTSAPASFNSSTVQMDSRVQAEQEAAETANRVLASSSPEAGTNPTLQAAHSSGLSLQRQKAPQISEGPIHPPIVQPIDLSLESVVLVAGESIFAGNLKLVRLARAFKGLFGDPTAQIKIVGYISADAQTGSAKEREESAPMQHRFNTVRDALEALGVPKSSVVVEPPNPSSTMGGQIVAALYKGPKAAPAFPQAAASQDKTQTNMSVTLFPGELYPSRDLKLTRVARAFRGLFGAPEAKIRLSGFLSTISQANKSEETEERNSMQRRFDTVRDILETLRVPRSAIIDDAPSFSSTRGGQLSVDVYAGLTPVPSPGAPAVTPADGTIEIKVHAVPIKVKFEKHGQSFESEISAELTLQAEAIAKGKAGPFEVSFGDMKANYALGLVGERKPGEKLNIKGKAEAEFAFTLVEIEIKNKIAPFPKGTKFSITLGFSSDFLDPKATPIEPKAEGELEIPLGKKNTLYVKLEATPGSGVGVGIGVTFDVVRGSK